MNRRGRTLIIRARPDHNSAARRRRFDLAAGLFLIVILASAAVFPLVSRAINPYDEGMIAYGAEQVLRGRQPAVHFYTPYGPGVFYLLAAAYRLLGVRLLVERWLSGALLVSIGILSYLLLATRGAGQDELPTGDKRYGWLEKPTAPGLSGNSGRRRITISLVAGFLIALLLVSGWWYTPVNGGTLALMLLSGLFLERGIVSGRPAWAGAAGVAAGVTLLCRFVFGSAVVLADAVVWAAAAAGAGNATGRRRSLSAGLLLLLFTAGLISLPIYGGLIHAGGQRALRSLFVWPFTSTSAADLPWPRFVVAPPRQDFTSLARLAAATHGAAFYYGFAAVALLLWRLSLRRLTRADAALGLWLLLLAPPLFLYAHGRTDYLHVTPLLTISMLLAALAVDSGLGVAALPGERAPHEPQTQRQRPRLLARNGKRRWSLRRPCWPARGQALGLWHALGVLLWTASLLALMPTVAFSWRAIWRSPGKKAMELPGARGAGVYAPYRYSRQYRELVPLIHAHVAPAQSLYSGSYRHDVYQINDILIYFLSERDAPTYYWCLDAGVTSSEPVQQEMLSELARNGVSAAVLWTASARSEENNGGTSSGVHLLDDWLSREFVSKRVPGLFYELRLRKGTFREE